MYQPNYHSSVIKRMQSQACLSDAERDQILRNII